MKNLVESLKNSSKIIWNESGSDFPSNCACYTDNERKQKEREADKLLNPLLNKLEHRKKAGIKFKGYSPESQSETSRAIIQFLNHFGCDIDFETEKKYSEVTNAFIQQAYNFDPTINEEAIYQALRNVWIMNSIQECLDKDIVLTSSIFAYSLLYPYTDNYLDSDDITPTMKNEFNRRLSSRLSGCKIEPVNRVEECVFKLVEMIEGEFSRSKNPEVYDSLFAIHEAQIRSVEQQHDERQMDFGELLDISLEKGGTSVLADGYLVSGNLTMKNAYFLFHFGVLLQFIDDLQDIQEDILHNQTTLFVPHERNDSLDHATNRLISFTRNIFAHVSEYDFSSHEKIFTIMERSCRLLIFDSVASNRDRYSKDYITQVENLSPVRFNYLLRIKDSLKQKYLGSCSRSSKLSELVNFMPESCNAS